MNLITAENKGFYASVLDVLRHIRISEESCDSFFIEWGTESLYHDPTAGSNAWEYFFEQPKNKYKPLCGYEPVTEVHGYIDIPESGQEFRQTINRLITEYLIYSEETTQYINNFFYDWPTTNDILGVHVRLTDKYNYKMFGEPESAKPLDLDTYISAAEKALDAKDLNKVFVATDSIEALNVFSKKFGTRMIATNSPRSSGNEAVHSGMKHVSGKLKGMSVIVDVEGLSSCKFLIRSTSNVGSFAQFKNLNLQHINLNEKLLGDMREREYGL